MPQETREANALLFKRAAAVSVGFLIFMIACSFIPGTNAYVGFPFNGYWAIWAGLSVFIFLAFFGGSRLFNRKA